MKATELRIGNLIEYKIEDKLDERKEWWKVSKVDFQDLTWLDSNPEDSDFRPIKITEEWLLNFGFNKDYKKGYIGKDFSNQDFVLTEPFVMGDWQKGYAFEFTTGGWSKYKEFNYIHELQNFYFTLTSEELTQVSEGKNKNFV